MKNKSTEISYREILITLDYLLNQTDELRPAKAVDICRYARDNYEIAYNDSEDNFKGNEIDRRRISKCLDFLYEFFQDYQQNILIEKNKSGKYYLKEKYDLHDDTVVQILASIKNDKYTDDELTEVLFNKILDLLSLNKEHRQEIINKANAASKKVNKISKETRRKIKLIEKAHKEGLLIKLGTPTSYVWGRVYFVQEYNGELYTFIIPLKTLDPTKNNYLCGPIENIHICEGPDSDVLSEEFVSHRDLNKLFLKTNPELAKKFIDIDDFIIDSVLPRGGNVKRISFFFNKKHEKVITRSFERCFHQKLDYQRTRNFFNPELIEIANEINDCTIVSGYDDNETTATDCLANLYMDIKSFTDWLFVNPHVKNAMTISDLVEIVRPYDIHLEITKYYANMVLKYIDTLQPDDKSKVMSHLANGYYKSDNKY